MRIVTKASGLAVSLAILAAGCASGGSSTAKPGDKPAAAKPGTAPAAKTPAKPTDPKAKPTDPKAKPTDPKAAPKTTETAKAPAKPTDPKAAPKPTDPKAAPKPAAATAPKPAATTAPKPTDPKAAPKPAATTAPKPQDPKTAPKPAATTAPKPTDPKAAPKAAATKTAPKPTDPKAPPKAAPPAAVVPAGAAESSSMDKWMQDMGRKFEEMKVLGMQFRPYLHEEIGYTDNVFYQNDDEVIVVDLLGTVAGGGTLDGNAVPANPGPMDPIGKIDDIFNSLTVGFNLELAVNSNLVPFLEEGKNSIDVFSAELNWVEYLTEDESPDAVNFFLKFDVITEFLKELLNMKTRGTTWYARLEADYSQITDPLDVPVLQYQGVNPTLSFAGNRVDFTRTEWFVKPTIGFKAARFDAEASYRLYDFSVDDESLDSADHQEHEFRGEVGWTRKGSEHRFYLFATDTIFDFPARGTSEDVPGLRNFNVVKAGPGWEGPFISKKLKGNIEAYYLGMNVHQRHPPARQNPDGTGDAFNESDGWGARTEWTYRPYITKGTMFTAEYERDLDWSVVSDYKVVDTGSLSMTHPINERLTTNIMYTVTHENVAEREKRLYQEIGLGLRYRLMSYTHLTFQYSFRTMASSNEPETAFSDGAGEIFQVQADGDFTANVVSVGINFDF